MGPIPGGHPVQRIYYYNLVDVTGFRYFNGQEKSGFSGRCRLRSGKPRCDPDDSGVIGSQADGFNVETDEGYSLTEFPRSRPALSSGALVGWRGAHYLLSAAKQKAA